MRPYLAAARLGRSPELVMTYSQMAVAFAQGGLRRTALRASNRAINLATALEDRLALARCHLYHGFVTHLCGGSVEAEAAARQALNEHGAWLDSMHYVDASGDLVFNLLLRGYFREAWVWIERMLPRLWFTIEGVRAIQLNPWAGPILAALGRTTEGLRFQDQMRDFCERAPHTERYMWGEMLSHQVFFAVEQGELGQELDALIERHHSLGLTPLTTSFHLRGFYVYQAYARLEQAMGHRPSPSRLRELEQAVAELRRATLIPSMRAHALVIAGALQRLQGAPRRALRLLDRADNLARELDSPWVRFEVARQRAHLLRADGNRPSSVREAKVALALALEQGWPQRARRIRGAFGVGDTSTKTIEATPKLSSRPTSSTTSLRMRRQLDALLQVSLASAQVLDPDKQARSALDEVVRILGAERGFLFRLLTDDGELVFQAGRDADGEDLDRPTGFSTTVIETVRERGEPLIVSGTEQGAIIGSQSVVTHDLRSIVAAPLRLRDRVIGVLYLDNRLARGVFTEEDVEILLAIGSHIAIAQETSRAAQLEIRVEAEAQKRQLAESLRDMSHALSSSLNLPEVLARLLDGVTGVVPCDRASVFLVEGASYELEVERCFDGMRKRAGLRVGRGDSALLDAVEQQRAPVVARDTRRDPRVEEPQAYLGSWIGVPLISQDRVAGVLTLESAEATYGGDEAGIAFTFAGQAGIAIENARLFGEVQRMAITDGLTQTLNRRHFFELAERELARFRRSGRPLCAILIDADHFKQVNDTHGHMVGDQVLRELARRCQAGVRAEDLLGRYGGEEFIILLPETPLAIAADKVAGRLRRAMADAPIQTDRGPVQLNISLGVAAARPGEALSSLIERADAALYRAKQRGRNRVEREG